MKILLGLPFSNSNLMPPDPMGEKLAEKTLDFVSDNRNPPCNVSALPTLEANAALVRPRSTGTCLRSSELSIVHNTIDFPSSE